MKKILVMLMALMLLTTIVVAQGNGNQPETTGQPVFSEEHPSVLGLENAMLRVRNEEQRQHLEQVMNKIQEQHRERLNQLEGIVFEEQEDGSLQAEGLGRGRFLGLLNLGYRYQYQIMEEDGELVRVRKPLDFLFTDLDEQLEVV